MVRSEDERRFWTSGALDGLKEFMDTWFEMMVPQIGELTARFRIR